jgi:outer membrane lipoprotein-sorting protein
MKVNNIKMNIMKRLVIACLIVFTSFSFAQDQEAKSLLNTVSEKVKSYDNITIDFKYTLQNDVENVRQETRGDVIIQGDKYLLNILGITRMYNGKTLYSISPEDEEVTISTENSEDDSNITPSKMLSFYEEGYTYKMDIVQNANGRKIQYIKLTPIDSNSETKHVLLGIDAKTNHIYNLIETGKNGTKTTLTVNSFKTNEPLSKTLFTFDESKYKDYYINKLD